jgi:hypothetical protein
MATCEESKDLIDIFRNQKSGYALGETFGTALFVAVIWVAFFIYLRPKLSWKYSARSHSKLLSER